MYGALCSANADFHGDFVRNIKTIRESQDLFDDLSGDPRDWAVAIRAEGEGHRATRTAAITRPFDYGTVISYSFDPSHWQATRFSDATRYGVWYGSLEAETTVHETVYHWHRFIVDSFGALDREITGERRLFDVRCETLLVDLRGKEGDHPGLVDRASYAYTNALGAYLYDQGANGLLVRSARCAGTNGAVFRESRLSNVRDRMYLTYRCNPAQDRCCVERNAREAWMSLEPSSLY